MKQRKIGPKVANNVSTNARLHYRSEYFAMCKIGAPRTTLAATVIDVSPAGVQCRIPNGLVPSVGENVCIEWPDTTANFAIVVWTRGSKIGLRFTELAPDYADKIDTAFLGIDNYCRIIANQFSRQGEAPAG